MATLAPKQRGNATSIGASISDLKKLLTSFQSKLTEFNNSVSVLSTRSQNLFKKSADEGNKQNGVKIHSKTILSQPSKPQGGEQDENGFSLSSLVKIPKGSVLLQKRDEPETCASNVGDDESDWDLSEDEEIANVQENTKISNQSLRDSELLNQENTQTSEEAKLISQIENWLNAVKKASPTAMKQYGVVLRNLTQTIFTPVQLQAKQPGVIQNLGGFKYSSSDTSFSNSSSSFAGFPPNASSTQVDPLVSSASSGSLDDFLENLDDVSLGDKIKPGLVGAPTTGAVWTIEHGWVDTGDIDPTVDAVMQIDMSEDESPSSAAAGPSSAKSKSKDKSISSGGKAGPRTLSQPLPDRAQRPSQVIDIRNARNDPSVRQDAQTVLDYDEGELHTTSTRPALIRPMGGEEDFANLALQLSATVAPGVRSFVPEDDEVFPDDIDEVDFDNINFASMDNEDDFEKDKDKDVKGLKKQFNERKPSPGLQTVTFSPKRVGSSRNSTPVSSRNLYPDDIDSAMDPNFDCDEASGKAVENLRSFVASVAAQPVRKLNTSRETVATPIAYGDENALDGLDDFEDDDGENVSRMRAKKKENPLNLSVAPIDNASRKLYEFHMPDSLLRVLKQQEENLRQTVNGGLFLQTCASRNKFNPNYGMPSEIKKKII